MRESRKYGSVRGAGSNARPYRDGGYQDDIRRITGDNRRKSTAGLPFVTHCRRQRDNCVFRPSGLSPVGPDAAGLCARKNEIVEVSQ